MEEEPKNKKKTISWSVTSSKNSVTNETTTTSRIRYEDGTSKNEAHIAQKSNVAIASRHSIMADFHLDHLKAVEKTKLEAEGSDPDEEGSEQ